MKKSIIILITIILLTIMIIGTGIFIMNQTNNTREPKEIESFEYNYGSYNGGYRKYKIYMEDSKRYISANGNNSINFNIEREIDKSVFDDISKIISENKIYNWDGFDKSDPDILDGYSFKLKLKYIDGEEINAKGYMKYPKNYADGHKNLSDYLERIK